MTNAEKREILNSFLKIEGRIQDLEEELNNLLTISTNVSSDGMPKNGGAHSKIEIIVEVMETTMQTLNNEKLRLEIIRCQIITAIDSLTNLTERRIMHLKYIGKPNGKYHRSVPLWEIANILGYSVDRVNHLHGEALNKIKL